MTKFNFKKYIPYFIYFILTALVMIPLFRQGYIFLLDMAFPPDLGVPAIVNGIILSNYPLRAVLHLFAQILGTPITEKLMLSFIFILPSISMYKLARKYFDTKLAFLAGLIYMANPWVYERFFSGQWLVMLGFGFLPIFIYTLINLLESPKFVNVIKFGLAFAVFPLLSQHFAYIGYCLGIVLSIIWFIYHRKLVHVNLKNIIVASVSILILFGALNSFWLYGALEKKDSTYQQIVKGDFDAFATLPDEKFGVYPNVLGLYGFWSIDGKLPKDNNNYWWIIPIIFIALSVFGFYKGLREKNILFILLGISFIPIVVISVGYGSEFSKHVVNFLLRIIPGFKGLRETEKLSSLIAFSYALLVPAGLVFINNKFKFKTVESNLFFKNILYAFVVVTTLISVHGIAWGYSGEVTANDYPTGWYEAKQYLDNGEDGKILLLPWHKYITISFADYRTVINPAISFFGNNILASTETENVYLDSKENTMRDYVTTLVQGVKDIDDTKKFLEDNDIGYILVEKESDWERYMFLDKSKILEKVVDTPAIILYRIK